MIKNVNWCLFILLTSLLFPSCLYAQSTTVHIYGFAESSPTKSLIKYLFESDCEVIFHSLNESSSKMFGSKIVETLGSLGIEVTPPTIAHSSACTRCEIPLFLYARALLMRYASPLIGFFRNGRLIAITLGITKFEILNKALNAVSDDGVKVFAFNNEYSLTDESITVGLENLFLQQAESGVNAPNILLSVALLALADSINPCTFAVFTALLFIALHTLSKTKVVLTGLSFIAAVFLCYYISGLGLVHILGGIPYVDKAVALVGLAVGTFSVTRSLKPKFKSPVPRSLRSFIELHMRKLYVSPAVSFALGAVVSLTLIPCSAGPYIVSLGLLSALNDPVQTHLLLALYNGLFITPLMVLLFAVLASRIYVRKIKVFRGTKLGVMELINGSILVMVCMYIILSA